MSSDHCRVCDRPLALGDEVSTAGSPRCNGGTRCDGNPLGWRSRALSAETERDDWRARYLEADAALTALEQRARDAEGERDHVVAVSQRIARHSRERIEIHRKWLRRVIGERDAAKRRAKAWKLAAKRQRQRAGAAIVAWRDALSRVRDEAGRGRGG